MASNNTNNNNAYQNTENIAVCRKYCRINIAVNRDREAEKKGH